MSIELNALEYRATVLTHDADDVVRRARMLTVAPPFETRAHDELVKAKNAIEYAGRRIDEALAFYESLPVEQSHAA
jgi:hypothetical protein